MTTEIFEKLETWKGGKATGYYDVARDEIHILKGRDTEYMSLFHERVHANRKDKLTFKIGASFQMPAMRVILFALFIATAISSLITLEILPLITTTSMYILMYACVAYEEMIATKLTKKSCTAIKGGD
jgi:hypothetical protein